MFEESLSAVILVCKWTPCTMDWCFRNLSVATPAYTGVTCGTIPVPGGWYTHFGKMDHCRLYGSGLWISIQNKRRIEKKIASAKAKTTLMKHSASQLSIVMSHAIGKSGADATTTGRLLWRSVNAGKGEYKSTQQVQPRPTEGDKSSCIMEYKELAEVYFAKSRFLPMQG